MSALLPTKPIQITPSANGISNNSENIFVNDTGLTIRDNGPNNTSISLIINNTPALTVNDKKRISINTLNAISRLNINDPLGECIRLIYNDSTYADINLNSSGELSLNAYNNNSVNIITSNPSTSGLKLNNVLVTASANQINYNNIQNIGMAEHGKALILDNSGSISGINYLSVDHLVVANSLSLNVSSQNFTLIVENDIGNCVQLKNSTSYSNFVVDDAGSLNIYNSNNNIEIISDNNNNLIYPLQLTTSNYGNNTGIGIKFNTYNSNNIKKNMSSIETIITSNTDNNENSNITFNNMSNGILSNTVTIRNDGYILCNTLMELSDQRKKKIINNSDCLKSLEKINNVSIYDFTYKDDSNNVIHKGVMAQELHKIIPSAVSVDECYTISNKEIIGYLIDSVKALSTEVNVIKNYKNKYDELIKSHNEMLFRIQALESL